MKQAPSDPSSSRLVIPVLPLDFCFIHNFVPRKSGPRVLEKKRKKIDCTICLPPCLVEAHSSSRPVAILSHLGLVDPRSLGLGTWLDPKILPMSDLCRCGHIKLHQLRGRLARQKRMLGNDGGVVVEGSQRRWSLRG
ncbi:hypothetical protein CRG98_029353 [Punica granatum]|uniref:Uncharacterized protein n=1 Tax=Punica granatum TaxID=22663 RepID=A0A2I0J2Y7_PUNGR|nr:hypothetical protein CRG98_029353 [Punica granatum]